MEEKPTIHKIYDLQLVDWYAVGLKLGVSAFQLDAIENENAKVQNQIMEMFSKWLSKDVEATNRKLLQILLKMKETEAATKLANQIGVTINDQRLYPGPSTSKTDLGAKPELPVLIDVAMVDDWYFIGLDLGVSEEALKCIKSNRKGDVNAMKREMLKKWLQDPTASYRAFIDVLIKKGLHGAAKELTESLGHRWQKDGAENLGGATANGSNGCTPPTNKNPGGQQFAGDTQTNRHAMDTQCTKDILMKIARLEFNWISVGLILLAKEQDVTDIKREEDSEQNRREKMLLKWWKQNGNQATYRCLVEVFKTTDNIEAAEGVEKLVMGGSNGCTPPTNKNPGGQQFAGDSNGCTPPMNITPGGQQSLQGDWSVCPGDYDNTDHCMVSSDGKEKVKAYKMNSKPFHGIALVISNIEFNQGCGFHRAGGEVDEKNVTELFGPQYLKYKVVLLKNLTARQIDFAFRLVSGYEGTTYATLPEEMKKPLKELNLTENLITADHDSFICVLMSHGDKGVLNGTDGKEFELRNIYNYLGPCKHLEGKPKMAFIQACQGNKTAAVPPVHSDGPPLVQFDDSWYTENTCDFLFSYSAFYGQEAFRHEKEGSFFINALCKVFKNNYKHKDVLAMTAPINDEVTKSISQCPRHPHSLRCVVLFAIGGTWGW